MKTHLLSIGILLSLCVSTLFAQENKENIFFTKNVKFTWDISAPIQTMEGLTSHLIITTETKIEAISFRLKWYLTDGSTILSTEKLILHSGNTSRTNDMPELFTSANVWYNLYILPSPEINNKQIVKVEFSGKFLTKSTWNDMGKNLLACK